MSQTPQTKEITIVVPVKDRKEIVERTLRSIEGQTLRPLSVVLVDNGSSDGTPEVLERWAETVAGQGINAKVISEPNPGAANARNAGLKEAETEWTMFFDSDDEMLPEHVERAMKCAEKHPKAQIIGWDTRMLLSNGKAKIGEFFSSDMHYNNIVHGGFATQRYMARTSLFRKAGGWNPKVKVWDDIELGVRLLSMSPAPMMYRVNGAPTVIVNFTVESITGSSWSAKAEDLLSDIDLMDEELPKKWKWVANVKRAQVARVCRKEGRSDLAAEALSRLKGNAWQRMVCRLASRLPSDAMRPWF